MFVLVAVLVALYINLLEYLIHRFLLHGLHMERHIEHHFEAEWTPYEKMQNVSIVSTAPIMVAWLVHAVVACLFQAWIFEAFVMGSMGYLGVLEAIHHWQHRTLHWPRGFIAGQVWIHHHRHHESPQINYNVFLPIWDLILGTLD